MRIVIALGGNALLRRGERPDADVQLAHLVAAAPALASIAEEHSVVFVHGNGPQVGLLALESATDTSLTRPYPLSDLVAETQGVIGYWLQQSLANAGLAKPIVTLVTQTVVDDHGPEFAHPTKFVGSGYDRARAAELAKANGWIVSPDGDQWRRVVPSPLPRRVVELGTADVLLRNRTTVILAGGGGVPVAADGNGLHGVDAVVDKDFAAALIAEELGAELLVMLTDVPAVFEDFGLPSQRPLDKVTVHELKAMEFPAGSMGPKISAAINFVIDTGGHAAIGSLDEAAEVVAGTVGTQISLQ